MKVTVTVNGPPPQAEGLCTSAAPQARPPPPAEARPPSSPKGPPPQAKGLCTSAAPQARPPPPAEGRPRARPRSRLARAEGAALTTVSSRFPDLTFDCDPGKIDDNAATGVEPVRRFQRAYNTNKAALGAAAPDLNPDGAVGPLTWGAFFDCYEFALQQELGEDATGLQALRGALTFVDDARKALGFSEHFPIEELGVDNFKSQSNRAGRNLVLRQR